MKVKVFFKENGRLKVKTIEAETEEDACFQVFELECESHYQIDILGVRLFPTQKIMPWRSDFANYCWGKGRIGFAEFKEVCYSPQILVTA